MLLSHAFSRYCHSSSSLLDRAEKAAICLQLRAAQNKIEAIHSTVDEEQAVTRGVLQEAQQRGVLIDQLKRDLEAATAENDVHRQDYEQ